MSFLQGVFLKEATRLTMILIIPLTALVNKNWIKKQNFFRFNPKFGQLRIVHDTVVVLSSLRNKLAALH